MSGRRPEGGEPAQRGTDQVSLIEAQGVEDVDDEILLHAAEAARAGQCGKRVAQARSRPFDEQAPETRGGGGEVRPGGGGVGAALKE